MSTLDSSFEMPGSDPSLSAYGPGGGTIAGEPLAFDELGKIDAYWRVSLYLCMGMQYTVGAGYLQPDRPVQPRDRRDRPYAAFPCHRVKRSRGPAQSADRVPRSRFRVRHRPARNHRLAVAVLKGLQAMTDDLEAVALTLVAYGKGLLAADETPHTLTHRFDTLGIQSTEKSRRTYRKMLFTAGAADFISRVILQDETIRQS